MHQICELRVSQSIHDWKIKDTMEKLDSIDKKLDMLLEALRGS